MPKKKRKPKRLEKLKRKLPKPRLSRPERLLKLIRSKASTDARTKAIFEIFEIDNREAGLPLIRKLLKDKKVLADNFLNLTVIDTLKEIELPSHFELLEELVNLPSKREESLLRSAYELEVLQRIQLRALQALPDLGAKGDVRVVPLLVTHRRHKHAYSALIKILDKWPKDKELKNKLDFLNERRKDFLTRPWNFTLLRLAVLMLPKIRRQSPTSKTDRRGMDYLRRLVDQSTGRSPMEVMKALGFDKAKGKK